MDEAPVPLADDEALVVPVDADAAIAVVAGVDPKLLGTPMPTSRPLLARFLEVASYGASAAAARRLTDGSLVRLAPETMKLLGTSTKFIEDAQGYALGGIRSVADGKIVGQARFLTGAANPVAAAMLLQTMAVQGQLRSIEQALERIDRKVEALGKAHRVGILARILAMATPIDEMRRKVASGVTLTAEDETHLRQLESDARELGVQARLWLQHLQPLRSGDRIRLREQQVMLTTALGDEHVAFWVKAAIASDSTLVQVLTLRSHRAAMAEAPEWAAALNGRVKEEIQQIGQRLFELHADMDRYLRDPDIARGWEELSFLRKRDVRRRRRELLEVANELRTGLEAVRPLLIEAMAQEPPALPAALDREVIESRVVRESLGQAAERATHALGEGASAARSAATRLARQARQRRRE